MVYRNDAIARKRKMSPEKRLQFHRTKSQQTVDRLHRWLKRPFDKKLVEPNSALGEVSNYMLNQWDVLTLFLHKPGAPLDNNICLRQDRGPSASRRVFLRMWAPRVGLGGPASVSVGHIVRRALARAALSPSSRNAAHLLRHSLATRMIRQGASITESSEVLRHRAQSTTQISAKVDFETLRTVARPWPSAGGAS